MCGIIGVWGLEAPAQQTKRMLGRLEYRGYDSAGIAWGPPGQRVRCVGRPGGLDVDAGGRMAIGHTRWATHGGVSERNAHPHLDATGAYALVHNGVLSNHMALRERLTRDGVALQSDTDSEVIVHLYARHREAMGPDDALAATVADLEGTWALVVMDGPADAIAFACHDAGMAYAEVSGGLVVTSDLVALAGVVDGAHVLLDGTMAVRDAEGLRVRGPGTQPCIVPSNTEDAGHVGFEDFLRKEIHEVPQALNACLAGRVRLDRIDAGALPPRGRMVLTGCGTSLHAARFGADVLRRWAGVDACAIGAGELVDGGLPRADRLVALSQSGHTHDTISAARLAKQTGMQVLAVTNTAASRLERAADEAVGTRVGPEISVAASKTFLGQTAWLAAWALAGSPAGRFREALRDELMRMPRVTEQVLHQEPALARLGRRLAQASSLHFIARGIHGAAAAESALKFQEITYVHASALPGSEVKHGPLAALDETTPCVAFAAHDATWERSVATVFELEARGVPVHVLHQGEPGDLEGCAASLTRLPGEVADLAVLPFSLAGQIIAYHAAKELGRDVDRPRHLAKSVTVP